MAEIIGLVIGLLDPTISRLSGLLRRHQAVSENKEKLQHLVSTLTDVSQTIKNTMAMVNIKQTASPRALLLLSNEKNVLQGALDDVAHSVQELEHILKPTRESQLRGSFAYARIFSSAESTAHILEGLQSKVDTVHLKSLMLMGPIILSEQIDRFRSSSEPDIYKRCFHAPSQCREVVVDFSLCTKSDELTTNGARLKQLVMRHGESTVPKITAATGMGGIGKTTTLVSIAWETDIRSTFYDGIFFMTLGINANKRYIIDHLSTIVLLSGGIQLAKRLRQSLTITDAVQLVSCWFAGKKVLFICDDVWPTNDNTAGMFCELRHLLSQSSRSAMLVSTRDQSLVCDANIVQMTSLDPLGRAARKILLNYAHVQEREQDTFFIVHQTALVNVLKRCAGVPLTIAVAGRAISNLRKDLNSWFSTLSNYTSSLDRQTRSLLDRNLSDIYPNFISTVTVSLHIANCWFKRTYVHAQDISCVSLFTRLCTVPPGRLVNTYVLCKLWFELNETEVTALSDRFVELSVLSRHEDMTGDVVFSVHDLLLEYCEIEARRNRMYKNYHRGLLNSYLHRPNMILDREIALLSLERWQIPEVIRPWWRFNSRADKGFMIHSVALLLQRGDLLLELVSLLSNARWTLARLRIGGIANLLQDFACCMQAFSRNKSLRHAVCFGLRILRDAVSDMGGYVETFPREMASQAHGRLLHLDDRAGILHRYMTTARELSPQIWLRPSKRYWSGPFGSRMIEIPLRDRIDSIGVCWKKRRVFVASEEHLAEIDLHTRSVVKLWDFPPEYPRCVAMTSNGDLLAFEGTGKSLAIWSRRKNAIIWARESAFSDNIESATWSKDGAVLAIGGVSGSLRCWAGPSGALLFVSENAHATAICSVAVSSNRMVSQDTSGIVRKWDLQIPQLLGSSPYKLKNDQHALILSYDGKIGVSTGLDDNILCWNVMDDSVFAWMKRDCGATNLLFTQDGQYLVIGDAKGTLEWRSTETWDVVCAMQGPLHSLGSIVASPDGKYVVSAGKDRVLRLWDKNGPSTILSQTDGHPERVECVAISSYFNSAVSVCGRYMKKWDAKTGSLVGTLRMHDRSNDSSSVSNDGRLVVTALKRNMTWWNVARDTLHENGHATRHEFGRVHDAPIVSVSVSGNGLVVVTVDLDGVIKWWDTNRKGLMYSFRTGVSRYCHSVMVASCYHGNRLVLNFSERLFHLHIHDDVVEFRELISHHGVWAVGLSRKGKFAVSGDLWGGLQVCTWDSKRVVWHNASAHNDGIRCVFITDDGERIVSAGDDRRLKIWDLRKRGCQQLLQLSTKPELRSRTAGLENSVGFQSEAEPEVEFVEVTAVTLPERPESLSCIIDGDNANGWIAIGDERGSVLIHELEKGYDGS